VTEADRELVNAALAADQGGDGATGADRTVADGTGVDGEVPT